MRSSLLAAGALAWTSQRQARGATTKSAPLWLGGPTFEKYDDPAGWVKAVKNLGYSAAYCPVRASAADDVVGAYARAAKQANIIIAEVGAWSNPISPDEKTRRAALEKCRRQLALADRIRPDRRPVLCEHQRLARRTLGRSFAEELYR
jgi:hypothetical protein